MEAQINCLPFFCVVLFWSLSAKNSLRRNLRVYLKSISASLILSWHFLFGQKGNPFPNKRRLDKFRTVVLPLAICFALFLVFFNAFLFLYLMNRGVVFSLYAIYQFLHPKNNDLEHFMERSFCSRLCCFLRPAFCGLRILQSRAWGKSVFCLLPL